MNLPRHPDLEPLATNDRATILVGMGLWAIALVVLLIVQPPPEQQWWIWTCAAGVVSGLFGLLYVHRRDRRRPQPESPAEQRRTNT